MAKIREELEFGISENRCWYKNEKYKIKLCAVDVDVVLEIFQAEQFRLKIRSLAFKGSIRIEFRNDVGRWAWWIPKTQSMEWILVGSQDGMDELLGDGLKRVVYVKVLE